MRPIKTAVFPVAGLGTRFLPATKAVAKEMLPVVDKPLIQYAVEEAVEAGITRLIFITAKNKCEIEDHFDSAHELENQLRQKNKNQLLEQIQDILPSSVSCIYIRQGQALGLGHAVLQSQPAIGEEPFAVILADDLIHTSSIGVLGQMVESYNQHGHSLVAVEEVSPSQVESYGIVKLKIQDPEAFLLDSIVEKPKLKDAPSNLGVVGRYILTPKIYPLLSELPCGAGGEIQLTDALSALLAYEPIGAYRFNGKRYDCGSKLGYLQANLALGLKHPQFGGAFKAYIKTMVDEIEKGE